MDEDDTSAFSSKYNLLDGKPEDGEWDTKDDADDYLHDPAIKRPHDTGNVFSARGWLNAGALVLIVVTLVAVFAVRLRH